MTDESESLAAPIEFEESAPIPVVFTESRQFERLSEGSGTLLLYYREQGNDEVVLDPENDMSLYRLFAASPYTFDNRRDLLVYESLITRAHYQLRLHPDQDAARAEAGLELSPDDAAELVVFVYRRDHETKSPVKNRQTNPFVNLDLEDLPPVFLFRRYSNDPAMRVVPVWRKEATLNRKIGLLGVRVLETF